MAVKDENGFTIFCDEEASDFPSEVLTIWHLLGLFMGFIALSAILVAVIVYINRGCERRKRTELRARGQERIKHLTSELGAKPWHGGIDSASSRSNDATETVRADASFGYDEEEFSSDSLTETPAQSLDKVPSQAHEKDGSQCAICRKPFLNGEPVYLSNNPQCQHCHHQHCMDRWLQFQNTCPTCNQPFVLQVV